MGDETASYDRTALHLVSALLWSDGDDEKQRAIVRQLFSFFHFHQTDSLAKSQACVRQGAIDAFLSVLSSDTASVVTKSLTLRSMGQMCCFNEYVSTRVAFSDAFIPVIGPLFQASVGDDCGAVHPLLLVEACYLINVVAADSKPSHEVVRQFIAPCVRLLNDASQMDEIHANCVRFLGQLSSNQSNIPELLANGALDPLVRVMRSLLVERACTSAAIAVANLVEHSPVSFEAFLPDEALDTLLNILYNALAHTMQRQDFPRGSNIFYDDWKLIRGISKLTVYPRCRRALHRFGVVGLVRDLLAQRSAKPEVVEYALITLWALCCDE